MENGRQALLSILEHDDAEQLEQLLQSNPAFANAQGSGDLVPVLYAAEYNRLNVLKVLLQQGVDTNAQDPFGNTALHYAAQHSPPVAAVLLVEYGADVEAANYSLERPIHLATQYDNQ